MNDHRALGAALLAIVSLLLLACPEESGRGPIVDEAMAAGRTADSMPQADEDYFQRMDGGIALDEDEVKGRNTWLVWTAGNDAFWDYLANNSFGVFDLLKIISSHPSLPNRRSNRFSYLGLINEPGFEQATAPDPERYGLWLDRRVGPPDPFENAAKYPGVKIGARGENLPVGSLYGEATGVLGLRLFPNPDFDQEAAARWDAERYYTDPSYYNDKDLVRPYRVGMSCAFCHVGPNPVNPPADPENPAWENVSSNVGAQYFWIGRIFTFNPDPSNFVWQLINAPYPGSLDTSLVATDSVLNPRTMNAVYQVGPRLLAAQKWGRETLAGGGLDNDQLPDLTFPPPIGTLRSFEPPDAVWTPHVLKDGSDSVGILGALNRVYINIGTFHQEWVNHFNLLVGGKPQSPMEIAVAKRNSAYWQATNDRAINLAKFFLKASSPHLLKDAPGGAAYLSDDAAVLARGKEVFADHCARCHSSKLPEPPPGIDYFSPEYDEWTASDDFKQQMRRLVLAEDFLDGNFLSNDHRYSVAELGTNVCSALATNALAGQVWDNFSSQTFKSLPAVGPVEVWNPYTGSYDVYDMPGGGRGYTRSPSLVSLWSTAPFLLNNSVGTFVNDPSVAGRMRSFDDSIEKLLWPEKRPGTIFRTTETSYLRVARGYLPDFLERLLELFDKEMIEIGPIPAGTPVGLLGSLDLDLTDARKKLELAEVLAQVIKELKKVEGKSDEEAAAALRPLAPKLLALSKCPDLVVDRGHEYGSELADADKRALIEFLKTM